jgi:hypothetical protein
MQAIPLLLTTAGVSASTAATVGTLATIATGVAATATAVQGARLEGQAQVSAANYQRQVSLNNATIATNNAERTRLETQVANQQQDQEAKADIGQLLAQGGASGLTLGVGSMGLRRKSAEQLASRDRAYTNYAGATKAAGFDQQSADFTASAAASEREAGFAKAGAKINIASSLISGASKIDYGRFGSVTGSSRSPTRPRARG